jgi:hypothetical protein
MDYNIFEGLTTVTNPSVLRAREDLANLKSKRIKKDESEITDDEIIENRFDKWDLYLTCNTCLQLAIMKKYNKHEMSFQVKRKNGIVIIRRCKKHAESYKPQSERVGGNTY